MNLVTHGQQIFKISGFVPTLTCHLLCVILFQFVAGFAGKQYCQIFSKKLTIKDKICPDLCLRIHFALSSNNNPSRL